MEHIYVEPEKVWAKFAKEKATLITKEVLLAEDTDYGSSVYLTSEGGRPCLIAYIDDIEVYSEECISEQDVTTTARRMYDKYLTSRVLSDYLGEAGGDEISTFGHGTKIEDTDYELEGNDDTRTELDQSIEIDDRESELDDAIYAFLDVVLDTRHLYQVFPDQRDEEACVDDVKDHILEYLARKWDIPVYRPMMLEDDEGEFFERYPYEHMIFEDEDNPIYQ